jgi:DNA-binding PadR family transcriptional regulator
MYDSYDRKMSRGRRQTQVDVQPGRLDAKAPIKSAVLAVLLEAPGHGYDVAKRVNRRMGWNYDPKHIYEPLKQLETAGLVWFRKEPIDEPPGFRKVFHPTEAAKEARRAWLDSPPAMGVLRADLHVRVAFSTAEDAPELLRTLGEARADLLEAIEEDAKTSWSAPRGSWTEFALNSLRNETDKRRKGEIEWINEMSEGLREIIDKRQKQ